MYAAYLLATVGTYSAIKVRSKPERRPAELGLANGDNLRNSFPVVTRNTLCDARRAKVVGILDSKIPTPLPRLASQSV